MLQKKKEAEIRENYRFFFTIIPERVIAPLFRQHR